MVDFAYLSKGLYALARAHQVNTMSGHLGAAVIAGYFIAEQHPDLDQKVYKGIEAELDQIIGGESVFSPGKNAKISAAQMFEPFPREQPQENLVDGIADALARNIGKTRQSGHNVIFASIAIRALKDHPDLATPALIDGIRRLIAGFDGATPGSGYYGKAKGRIDGRKVPLPKDASFSPYPDLESMAVTVMDELIENAARHRQGFGGLWHVINHAAGLIELTQYGYRELALKGLPAHHQHVRLLRTLPDVADELGAETPTEYDPLVPEFWEPGRIRRGRAHLTHRVKTLYGFDTMIELIADQEKRRQGRARLRYLM
jgi:hypothetical protein